MARPAVTVTRTDESPELSAVSLLPLFERFLRAADIDLATIDISFAGRILAAFPEYLKPEQRRPDDLKTLRELVERADAAVIKLPNASATPNQLGGAVAELQKAGFAVPDYPEQPRDDHERAIKSRYDALTGSVVNPVLRQGNAVRSIPAAVKEAARANPHPMGEWRADSETQVRYMKGGDFYANEKSATLNSAQAGTARIEFVSESGETALLKEIDLSNGEVVDAALMDRALLQTFLEDAIAEAKKKDLLLSLHLKATMMKNTDGVIFGEAMRIFFKDVFEKYENEFSTLGVDPRNGLSDLRERIQKLDEDKRRAIEADIERCLAERAPLAMANVKQNVTHLDSPNTVIMDVSMANLARWGGQLPDAQGNQRDTLALIPDSTYARMHEAGVRVLQERGSPDPAKMGSVTTVRLQAGGAEEYGSRDTTFEAKEAGSFRVVTADGEILHAHQARRGDIWRVCRTQDDAVRNWVELALETADEKDEPVIFWLDQNRAHDAELIKKVKPAVGGRNDISILSPQEAMRATLTDVIEGRNATAATGNLIGDHVTDYFPIMEIASSSKMLSLIKLLNGGLVAESGSGGTAPDLLNMLAEKNHFLWDDVGTALAMAEALKHIAESGANDKAAILARTLEEATAKHIRERRSPAPAGLDARQSQFWLVSAWADALARQDEDAGLRETFQPLARAMAENRERILEELKLEGQGDYGGRYYLDPAKTESLMRPSATLNELVNS